MSAVRQMIEDLRRYRSAGVRGARLTICDRAADMLEVLNLLHPGGLEEIEWSGKRHGPGDGPMGSGPGPAYPACPVCGGLKERSPGFIADAVGHKEGCELEKLLKGEGR